ncbi:MAG: hypothetical protein J0I77_17200 [Rudaea sp.]|uniref:hypothetical protein n=1 Tax=unclassified Rudaea TaxID=2627037 RepID=UPI001485AF1D|nr:MULTISPECIES: hypothetical protein [unclassified Rudaea]MBN8887464.1 hypothetical protein [Rudaea sp.]MBR0344260.1 hypothetical protein [Rudaea sp.]
MPMHERNHPQRRESRHVGLRKLRHGYRRDCHRRFRQTLPVRNASRRARRRCGAPMTAAPYPIFDAASARAAANLPRGARVALVIPGADPHLVALEQARINALLNECGCRLSATVLMACVAAVVVFDVVGWTVLRESPVGIVTGELLAVFVAAGIGRWVGIANARRKLRIVLSAIGDRIDGDHLRRRASWAV